MKRSRNYNNKEMYEIHQTIFVNGKNMVARVGFRCKKQSIADWGKLGEVEKQEILADIDTGGHVFTLGEEEPSDSEIASGKKAQREKGDRNVDMVR